ncbi:hypothetical protein FC33_GL000934 [Ligilactobacillus aviarius subsp. aviarius DSM 20655]|nr:hypothetical protein FC33_GL000934 [Ligilactobacillus aviarius subsp. aviarius DSM 20655]
MMEKKRFKMYKAGKKWVFAPIVFFGLTALGTTSASADTIQFATPSSSSQQQIQSTNDEKQQAIQSSSVALTSSSEKPVSSSNSQPVATVKSNEVSSVKNQASTVSTSAKTSTPAESVQSVKRESLSSQAKTSVSSSPAKAQVMNFAVQPAQSTAATSKTNSQAAKSNSKETSKVAQSASVKAAKSSSQSVSSSIKSSVANTPVEKTIQNENSAVKNSPSVSNDANMKVSQVTPVNLTPANDAQLKQNPSTEVSTVKATTNSTSTTQAATQTQPVMPVSFAASGTPYIDISQNQGYVTPDTVDISSYQPNMSVSDFQQLKKYGIKNVIVKTSQYSDYVNPYATQQIQNAEAAGLNVAVYHYAGFANPAQATQEADYLAGVLQKLNVPKDMAVICDLESGYTKNGQVGSSLSAFWKELGNRGYTNQVLYTYQSYANEYPQVLNTIAHNKIWMAQYPYSPTNYWNSQYGAWQYNDDGHCPGISYTFDLSHCYNPSIFARGGQAALNGQQFVNGHWQFYKNGQAVRNQYVWIGNQNKEVYYDGNGNMVYGQQNINGHWQYFDTVTGAQAKSQYVWIANQNKEVYYDDLGNMVYGQQKINGKWQYFDTVTGAQAKNQYIWIGNQHKEVYYDGLGNMVYGQQYINGHWQYFDPITGAQAKNQYVWIGNQHKEVYYDGLGNMVYGQQKINGKWQYFDTVTGAQAKNQYVWIASQNKEVYYNGLGNMVYGWQVIGGHKQYFDPATGAQVKNTTITIDGKKYIFDRVGNLI